MVQNEIRGLGEVRLAKEFLVNKLVDNRQQHVETYTKALDAWHVKVIKKLKNELKKVEKDINYFPSVYVSKPFSHESEYDKVIDMLGASLDKEFILSSAEFSQYMMDDWKWKSDFTTTVSGCYVED